MSFAFSKLPLERRLIAVNAGVFLVIALVALLTMTEKYEVPAPPPMDIIERHLENIGTDGGRRIIQRQSQFRNFGRKNIFTALIPIPTPTPTPLPTEPPDPPLDEAIKQWAIKGLLKGIVLIEDPRTRDEFHMDMDDPSTITKTVRFKNEDMVIQLESIDDINMTATFSYTGRRGKQTVTRGMFEDQ